jgi:hypothetical protein
MGLNAGYGAPALLTTMAPSMVHSAMFPPMSQSPNALGASMQDGCGPGELCENAHGKDGFQRVHAAGHHAAHEDGEHRFTWRSAAAAAAGGLAGGGASTLEPAELPVEDVEATRLVALLPAALVADVALVALDVAWVPQEEAGLPLLDEPPPVPPPPQLPQPARKTAELRK